MRKIINLDLKLEKDILENVIIREIKSFQYEITMDFSQSCWLYAELYNKPEIMGPTFQYISKTKTPLEYLNDLLKTRITDEVENEIFELRNPTAIINWTFNSENNDINIQAIVNLNCDIVKFDKKLIENQQLTSIN